jgi:hypothetical protein
VVLGDLLDVVVILAIVVLNGALGYLQEYRAEQSMAALKRLFAPTGATCSTQAPSSATHAARAAPSVSRWRPPQLIICSPRRSTRSFGIHGQALDCSYWGGRLALTVRIGAQVC